MSERLKKAGSLALGIGALSLVLFNAAMTHGCGGSRAGEPTPQVASEPPAEAEPLVAPKASASSSPNPKPMVSTAAKVEELFGGDGDCEEPPYMPATKAAVMPMRRCKPPGGAKSESPTKNSLPPQEQQQQQQQAP
jgi:hypothetical protein